MGSNTVILSDATFGDAVGAEKPVLVDFWAEWCGPCRLIAPILDEMATEYSDKVTVAKLNVDENPYTAARFDVMSIPTLILYKDGVEKKRIIGARPKHSLVSELSEFLA
jgi:thioredoxin 1